MSRIFAQGVSCTVWTVLLAASATPMLPGRTARAAEGNKWESAIQAFEKKDQENPPAPEGIVFVGSSSIVRWKLADSFPGLPAINRGFGGSQLADSVYFADRIVIPYKPKIVVLYAGDNDLASMKTPEQVADDYQAFVKKIHAALPTTQIVYVGIKPSIRRWALVDKVRKANSLIKVQTEKDSLLTFVDVDQPMLGDDGMPRKELFVADGLHLSEEGYKLWNSLVLPHLKL